MRELHVLNLGAGVQSTTLYLLSLHGKIQRLDAAIFADTQDEPGAEERRRGLPDPPGSVYAHLDWLDSLNGRNLEFRRLPGEWGGALRTTTRYGALTREEIETSIAEIDRRTSTGARRHRRQEDFMSATPECRYKCGQPVTHVCRECDPGYFCAEHAERHDRIVLSKFKAQGLDPTNNAILAQPITADMGRL